MRNRNNKELLFYFTLIFILGFSLNLAVADFTGMDTSPGSLAAYTAAVTAIIMIMVVYPLSMAAFTAVGLGWMLYLYYRDQNIVSAFLEWSKGFYNWLYWYISGNNPFEQSYSLAFLTVYDLLAMSFIFPVVFSGKGSLGFIFAGTALYWAFWLLYVEKAKTYFALFLLGALTLYSYQLYGRRLKAWRSSDTQVEKDVGTNWIFISTAAVSIALVASLALPLNIEPVRWPWLNDSVVRLFPFMADLRNDSMESFSYGFNSRFSLNSAGYISRRLGGAINADDSVLMTLRTRSDDTLYLRGTVKEKYLGNSWYKSERNYKQYTPGDPMDLPFGEGVRTLERTLEIKNEKLVTSTIFAPYSVYKVMHDSRSIFSDEDSEVYASKMTMKGEAYSVICRIPSIDETSLRFARIDNLSAADLAAYTAIDPDIPERVKELAYEITAKHNNNYDKAKALEEYLRKNYKYNRKPGELPQNAEFIDHFLFEGKEGYCTYFATAMSILLREVGIPSRYVEGFISRYDGRDSRAIKGSDAHAWVEVYFDDHGWVTFEPTPYYPQIEIASAPTMEAVRAPVPAEANTGIKAIGADSKRLRELHDMDVEVGDTVYEYEQQGTDPIGKLAFFIDVIVLLLMIALVSIFIFRYAKMMLKEAGLRHANGRAFAVRYLEIILSCLFHSGFSIDGDETLREYLKRLYEVDKIAFSEAWPIALLLEKMRYGDYQAGKREKQALEAFKKKVKRFAVKKAGFVYFYFGMYITGKREEKSTRKRNLNLLSGTDYSLLTR